MKLKFEEKVDIGGGRSVVIESAELREGVILKVYNGVEAEITIEGGEAPIDIPFRWSEENWKIVEKMLDDLRALIVGSFQPNF